jgi:5-oxoprolinase (ATP-hydrolysing)
VLGQVATSQGTLNKFSFGNGRYQYSETICCGSAAKLEFARTAAVQTHMVHLRLTDPEEVLELRFPVLLVGVRDSTGQWRWGAVLPWQWGGEVDSLP